MRRLIIAGFIALASMLTACVPAPAPDAISLGDSVGWQIGALLPGENYAVGGSTVCDTAADLPPVERKVFIHAAGHSWGQYDAATAQACLLHIIDHYHDKQVYVATTPQPMAIFCLWGDYEADTRLKDFDAWKRTITRPNVHLVELNGIGVGADCTHLTEQGAATAAARVQAKGF